MLQLFELPQRRLTTTKAHSVKLVASSPLIWDNRTALFYKAKFACGIITRGGRYGVRVLLGIVDDRRDQADDGNEVFATNTNETNAEFTVGRVKSNFK